MNKMTTRICSNCLEEIVNPEYLKYLYCDKCHVFSEKHFHITVKQELYGVIGSFVIMIISLILLAWSEFRDNNSRN